LQQAMSLSSVIFEGSLWRPAVSQFPHRAGLRPGRAALASRESPVLVAALPTADRDSDCHEDGNRVRDDHSKKRCVI
jgi:hypothetical protein